MFVWSAGEKRFVLGNVNKLENFTYDVLLKRLSARKTI